jgi:hypothetical protein
MASGWPGRAFRSGRGRVLGWGRSGSWFESSLGSIVNRPRCSINIIYISVVYHPDQPVAPPTESAVPPLTERIACINGFECLVAKPD